MNHCLLFNVVNPEKITTARTSGVYRVAHHLRNNGWDVEVIDFAYAWTFEELKALAMSRVTIDTKFFGFSHMFSTWNTNLEEFIGWSRTKWNLKYISGSSVNPLFESKQIDYYIQGFGENAIEALLKYLFSNGERPIIRVNTGKRIINANADYPSYPMEDLSIIYEKRDFINQGEWLNVEFSRGCMFSCDFCNFPLIGIKEDTSRSSESFREEMIRNYETWGVTNYTVADETFNDRPSKIKKFADVVETLPFEPFYTGFVRGDLLVSRKEDRVDMARMNFRGHYYGVESFNYQSAKAVGKGMKSERLKEGLVEVKNYFKQNGNGLYRGTIGLIIGLPYESKEDIVKTREWLLSNWVGESVFIWPLIIPDKELEVKSKMFDHTKYGYTVMSDKTTVDNSLTVLNNEGMYWQNEHMNVVEAYSLVFDLFYNKQFMEAMQCKVGNFELSSYCLHGDITTRLDKLSPTTLSALSKSNPEYVSKQFMFDFMRDKFIEDYKRRKLSL